MIAPPVRAFYASTVLVLCLFRAAALANQTVSSLADDGPGTLRYAINLINSGFGGSGNTITFSVTGTIALLSGRLQITHDMVIAGPGAASLTIARAADASTTFPIFQITANHTVTISGVSVTQGKSVFEDTYRSGGAIGLGAATLTLDSCALADNQGFDGGAITNNGGTLTVKHCLLAGNKSVHGQGPSDGGGIASSGGSVSIENCTFYGNHAFTGGGILQQGGSLQVIHSTFAENTTSAARTLRPGNCILLTSAATFTIANTILNAWTGSGAPALSAVGVNVTSNGYNTCSDDDVHDQYSCPQFLTQPTDQVSTDAKLDPAGLQNNGGPTQTVALLSDSPALDKGNSFGIATDQRGQPRPHDLTFASNAPGGDGSDIGAYETSDVVESGDTLRVTTTDDHDDGLAGLDDCTLREAINLANSRTGTQSITFAPGLSGTITLQSALGSLSVTDPVIIDGPGARVLSVSGNNTTRVLVFNGTGPHFLSGLTIRDGHVFGSGGGILNNSDLTVRDCAFVADQALARPATQPGENGPSANGGAIFNGGTLTLERCAFDGNSAHGGLGANNTADFGKGGAGGAANGSALCNNTSRTAFVANCTFANNNGLGGNGGRNSNFQGGNGGSANGAVYNLGDMTMIACTLSANTGTGGTGGMGGSGGNGKGGIVFGGLFAAAGSSSTIADTISAGNTGFADAFGSFTSAGYNLIGKLNSSSGFTMTGDQTGTTAAPLNAQLGSFQNNGGSTDTFLPLAGSPAVDKGASFGLTTDQRRIARRVDNLATPNASGGDGTDIGAAEVQPAYSGPLRVISFELIVGNARVLLQGTPAVNYQLERLDMLGGSFALFGHSGLADDLGVVEFVDYGPLPGRRFYRGIQVP